MKHLLALQNCFIFPNSHLNILPMSSDLNFSASRDSTLDFHEQVQKWKKEAEPLSEIQEVAHWMATKIADEQELYHDDVVSYISKKYGLNGKYVSTRGGGDNIDEKLVALFKEPFTPVPKWKGAALYHERKWFLQ